jgi:hypothetical protein
MMHCSQVRCVLRVFWSSIGFDTAGFDTALILPHLCFDRFLSSIGECGCNPLEQTSKATTCTYDANAAVKFQVGWSPFSLFIGGGHFDKYTHNCVKDAKQMSGCSCCRCDSYHTPQRITPMGSTFFWVEKPFLEDSEAQNAQECEQSCSKDAACMAGSFVTSFAGEGNCYLSATVLKQPFKCYEPCESFVKTKTAKAVEATWTHIARPRLLRKSHSSGV